MFSLNQFIVSTDKLIFFAYFKGTGYDGSVVLLSGIMEIHRRPPCSHRRPQVVKRKLITLKVFENIKGHMFLGKHSI